MNPYTTNTVDSPSYKRLFCGRANELSQLLDMLARGQSVALFGERRIGKSMLLFVLRDLLNGDIGAYENDLLDATLQAGLAALRRKLTDCTPVFISLQEFAGDNPTILGKFFLNRFRTHGFLRPPYVIPEPGRPVQPVVEPGDLPQLFASLHRELQQGHRRAVVLMDQVDVLLDDKFAQATQVFRQLLTAMQAYPDIVFVCAGAEDWHRHMQDRTSPLVGHVEPFYLKAAAPADIENYLLGIPLRQTFPDTDPALITAMIRQVLEWTGGKPYFVQAAGDRLARLGQLTDGWQKEIALQVQEDSRLVLADFYDKIDPVSQQILALLAHAPGLTVHRLAQRLGVARQTIWDRVDTLTALDKVRWEGGEYRIVGTLIAAWGKKYRDLPVSRRWSKRLRLSGTFLALALAVGIAWYAHPPSRSAQFAFPQGTITVTFPSRVEAGEHGTLSLAVRNTGPTTLPLTSLNLAAEHIEFLEAGSSRLTIKDLESGETRYVTMAYRVRAAGKAGDVPVRITIYGARRTESGQYDAVWHLQSWPVKRWWKWISPSLLFLGVTLQWSFLKSLLEVLRCLLGDKRDEPGKTPTGWP